MGEEYNLGDRDGVILRDPGAVSEGGGGEEWRNKSHFH